MKRRERFMAATGWNVRPTRRRSGQCFPRLCTHLGPPRQEGALLDLPQRPRTVHRRDAVFPTGSPLKSVCESTNFGSVN